MLDVGEYNVDIECLLLGDGLLLSLFFLACRRQTKKGDENNDSNKGAKCIGYADNKFLMNT